MAVGVGAAQSCEAVLSFSQSREGRLAPIPLKLHTVTVIQVQEIPLFLQRMDGKQARSMGSKQCHGTAVPKQDRCGAQVLALIWDAPIAF